MKVACPHCSAAYSIDDRRVPASGLNVKCPKCRSSFPVRRAADGEVSTAVPLPAAPAATSSVPLPPPLGAPRVTSSVPLPPPLAAPPVTPSIPLPPPVPVPPTGSIPLPPPHESPFAAAPDPFGLGDAGTPFAHPPTPFGASSPAPVEPLGFGEVSFDDAGSSSDPLPTPVDDAPASPAASGPSSPGPALVAPAGAAEELEMLFGADAEKPAKPAKPPRAPEAAGLEGGGYRVRRRSGKVFGPFSESQIAEMLSKGELLGNEDVSLDGADFAPMGSVAAFADALQRAAADEPDRKEAPPRAVPFGDRMAAAKVVEGEGSSRPALPPWARRAAIPALVLGLVLVAGVGAGFTPYGFFLGRLLRRSDSGRAAQLAGQARAALAKGDYASDLSALDLAAKAVAADEHAPEALATQTLATASLARRHAAPPEAVAQARRGAERLGEDAPGELSALAARLAVALVESPGATLAQETAVETASAKAKPDPDVLALLGEAALARGDAARAEARFARLTAVDPGPRGPLGQGRAALAARRLADAKAALEAALARSPGHLGVELELAAVAEAAGDVDAARARLAPLLDAAARPRLSPLERGRAQLVHGALLARRRAAASEADQAYQAAIAADPELLAARVALARHRLRGGDPARAVEATDPVAAKAIQDPELAAVRIRALALSGRALDASQLADQALGTAAGNPALRLAQAAAVAAAGNVAKAKEIYASVLERDPGAVEPRVALAHLALSRGELDTAATLLAAAVEKDPKDPSARAALGDLAAARGDATAAEAEYRRALSADPDHAPAEIGLARLALARGDVAAAKAGLARALALDPRNADGHLALGTLAWRSKDLAGAEEAFQAVVALRPKDPVALTRLGAVKLERGDTDAAIRLLTAASNEDDRLAEPRLWLGKALLAKGETPNALAQLRKAVELEPKNPQNHVQLGIAHERSGELAEALEAYRAAAAADPKLSEPHERAATLLASMNRLDEAIAEYQQAIPLAGGASALRLALGECQARRGHYEDAVKTYRELMKADPAAVQAFYLLARAVHELEGPKAALPWYERAARDDRANAMPHYFLGYAYKERGQRKRAVQEFKAFLALKPDAPERKDIEAEIEDLGGAVQ